MSIRHLLDAMSISIIPGSDRKLPASHKLALAAVADDASDKTNRSWPGLEKVMTWSGTGKRRSLELLADLGSWGLIQQVEAGYPGKRAVYLLTLPPVDNSPKMGAESRTTGEMGAEKASQSAESRTPLRRPSPVNTKSSTSTHVGTAPGSAVDDGKPIAGWLSRRRHARLARALDDTYLLEQLGELFLDFEPDRRPMLVRSSALLVLGRALRSGTRVAHPNAYVVDAITRDPEPFRKRAYEQEAAWTH